VQADVAAHGATHAGLRQSTDPPCPGPTGDTAKTQATFVPKTSVAHGKQAACGRPASHPAASAPAWHPQRVASPGCCRLVQASADGTAYPEAPGWPTAPGRRPSNVTIRRARRPHKPRVTLTCSYSPLREGLANTVPRGIPGRPCAVRAQTTACQSRRRLMRCGARIGLSRLHFSRARARARCSHEPRAAMHQTSALCRLTPHLTSRAPREIFAVCP